MESLTTGYAKCVAALLLLLQVVVLAAAMLPANAAAQADQPSIDKAYFEELLGSEDCSGVYGRTEGERVRRLIDAKCEYATRRIVFETDKVNHIIGLYRLQHVATLVGTFLVHLLVLVGTVASVLEFKAAHAMREKEASKEWQEVSIKMEGLAIKTTLTGFLILITSLAFYFLYLKTVYPIS